jgi:putative Ca2+/H+ antiporter (TMEM165/GDT1 family)
MEGTTDVWKIFFTSFGIMFLAELGDKTQLTILSLAGRYRSPWVIFAGAALAMILATGLGVLVGNFLPSCISERAVRYVSGGLFMLFGILVLAGK